MNDDFMDWLNKPWDGKDKQESVLRLFCALDILLDNYMICKHNFNIGTISPMKNLYEFFYQSHNKPRCLKDKSSCSDLTCISKKNEKEILVTTSKRNIRIIGKMDFQTINFYAKKYKENSYNIVYCVCVRNEKEFYEKLNRTEKSTKDLKDFILNNKLIVIDWKKLEEYYYDFKKVYSNLCIQDIFCSNVEKKLLILRMHQQVSIDKTMDLKKNGVKQILWGHIQRSGKSYMIGGCVIHDSSTKKDPNYLVITTAPKQTFTDLLYVFSHKQLDNFNITLLNNKNKYPNKNHKNIILCSKQYLQNKDIDWMKKMKFDIVFIDESHNGGTTFLTKHILNLYTSNSFLIHITATYKKPKIHYSIPSEHCILWDMEDIKYCQDIQNEVSRKKLIQKHGNSMKKNIMNYNLESIKNEYDKYPELCIFTESIHEHIVKDIHKKTIDNNYGWSFNSIFLLHPYKKFEFYNPEKVLEDVIYRIFPNPKNKNAIYNKNNEPYMKRIERICMFSNKPSRFIGHGSFQDKPAVILAFLPQNNIYRISNALKLLLEQKNILPDYLIECVNSIDTNDPKQTIKDATKKAKNFNKKAVLILSGKQCILGITIKKCDIVLLLNDCKSFDALHQSIHRCMTPLDKYNDKRYGFVVDLNVNRMIIHYIIEYCHLLFPNIHPKKSIKYLLEQKLIHFNPDERNFHQMTQYDFSKLSSSIYTIYNTITPFNFNSILDSINQKLYSKLYLIKINKYIEWFYKKLNIQKELLKYKYHHVLSPKNLFKKGIEKHVDNNDIHEKNDVHEKNNQDNNNDDNGNHQYLKFIDLFNKILFSCCLITIHHDNIYTLKDMFIIILKNKYLTNILISEMKLIFKRYIHINMIKKIISIYYHIMNDDDSIEQLVISIKELLVKHKYNPHELSKIIDTYLVPSNIEKKMHAEISTPHSLRKDMLDTIPEDFWTSPKKVFEPCSGKGGFLIDIVSRFMEGLKDYIPDEVKRYKTIVEDCIYFSDINPTNIFINKLLIDPDNKYILNLNEGNTLELDIKTKWNIEGFDAVIGNPPYQNNTNNKGKGNTLWDRFVKRTLMDWVIENGYVLYVHPQGWRQLDNKVGKLLLSKQLLYLNMNDVKTGIKLFNCSTTFDYYLLKNCSIYQNTIINDYKNKEISYNLKNIRFIPNHSVDTINKYFDFNNEYGLIKDRSKYGTERNWVSKNKDNEYIYPCIYSINSKNEISLRWSKINSNGHFGVSKYIISNGNGYYKDLYGKYGCTEWSYYIKCSIEDMDNIHKCFENKEFLKLVDAVKLTSNKYNYVILKHLKKDFWKEFI